MTVTVTQETIGPEQAKELLKLNTHNRTIKVSLLNMLVRDMINGSWRINGETLKFSKTNVLLDGQHRLQAVIDSGKTYEFVIVRGLDDEVQGSVDIGAKRTVGDQLRLDGEQHYSTLAAMLRLSWLIDNRGGLSLAGNAGPSAAELMAYLKANPDIRNWVPVGIQAPQSSLRIPGSISGGLGFQMSRLDPELAVEFWRQLLENDAKKGTPIFVLREMLERDLTRPHRMATVYRTAVIIKTWNFWQEGRTPTLLAWRPAGGEDFPRFHPMPLKEAVSA